MNLNWYRSSWAPLTSLEYSRCGFLEVVYHRALVRELSLRQVPIKAEVPYDVCYKGERIARYLADIIVDDQLIVELKCADQFTGQHLAQCLNYLKYRASRQHFSSTFKIPKWSGEKL